jgi:hypothetical protein
MTYSCEVQCGDDSFCYEQCVESTKFLLSLCKEEEEDESTV